MLLGLAVIGTCYEVNRLSHGWFEKNKSFDGIDESIGITGWIRGRRYQTHQRAVQEAIERGTSRLRVAKQDTPFSRRSST